MSDEPLSEEFLRSLDMESEVTLKDVVCAIRELNHTMRIMGRLNAIAQMYEHHDISTSIEKVGSLERDLEEIPN
jgi:hypothetical protein